MAIRRPQIAASGFTLIELILALGLSVVLLALLASAMSLGMSQAMKSRKRVEQARLVDGVVALLRNDIHRAVIYNPQDTSSAMELAEASAAFDVDSLDEISSDSGGGGGSGSSSGSDTSIAAISLRKPLGLYGTIQELQMDVLRERPGFELDSTGSVVAATGTSGITSVRYALGQGAPTLGSGQPDSAQLVNGLVRQEINRDLLNWAEQSGNAATVVGTPRLIASEVSRLEIRYFDGVQLVDTWDTELMQGVLPRAIELRLWFTEQETDEAGDVQSVDESAPYVMTIALPSTWNTTDIDMAGATSDAGADASSGDSTSSGSTSSGGSGR